MAVVVGLLIICTTICTTMSPIMCGYTRLMSETHERKYSLEDATLNFTQLANKYGNDVEEYDVITEDGYILTVFHVIPDFHLRYTPILLQHGILDSADTFIIRGNLSLARTLARAGHDVWVGNCRGNRYSTRHIRLDAKKDPKFWDFSIHELAIFDAAAMIDFILSKTGKPTINIIGHSLGNTIFYILSATKPDYNIKINLLVAMAPIAFLHHTKPPIPDLLNSADLLINLSKLTGMDVLILPEILKRIICTDLKFGYEICANGLIFGLSGDDPKRLDRGFFPTLMGHYPQAVASKVLIHLTQIAKSKKFSNYDYGVTQNLEIYKTVSPPEYNLNLVRMPVALFASKNDKLSSLENVRLQYDALPNVITFFVVKPRKWNHVDWVWGLEIEKYVYPYLFQVLSYYI